MENGPKTSEHFGIKIKWPKLVYNDMNLKQILVCTAYSSSRETAAYLQEFHLFTKLYVQDDKFIRLVLKYSAKSLQNKLTSEWQSWI